MRYKKILIFLLALVLLLSFPSCKKGKEAAYYSSRESRHELTSSVRVPMGDYSFDAFLNRGMIRVSQGGETEQKYGVLNLDGEVILPARYESVTMQGDFFLLGGDLSGSLYEVASLEGERVYASDLPLSITDVGGGCVAITEGKNSYLYDSNGNNILPGTSLDNTYEYLSCGAFVIARSAVRNNAFVFHALTSEIRLRFLGSESVSYEVSYAGGNNFIVIRNETVTEKEDYTFALKRSDGTRYFKQTLSLYVIGSDAPRSLEADRPIVSVSGKYAFGVSEEEREKFSLNEGYFAVRYYVTEGKTSDGTMAYYLSDASLREIRTLPSGISPILTMVDGRAAALSNEGAIYLFDQNLAVLAKIDDAPYQSLVFSGGVITASKLVNGARRIGGFDLTGKEVIPFEYSYISEFYGEKAVATKGGKAYLVDKQGGAEYVAEAEFPFYWEGFYEKQSGGLIGLTSFGGHELFPCRYQSFKGVRRYGDEVLVALEGQNGTTEVYRLF